MVKQVRFSDLSDDDKRCARHAVARFTKKMCAERSGESHGILKMRDARGQRRKLFTHQVIAAQRLIGRCRPDEAWSSRKASQICIHDVGSGKTITAILALAYIRKLNPHRNETKTLIVVPLSVLDVWCETVQSWTTLGDLVLRASQQAALTDEAIARAAVIITTPDVLVAAFLSFVYKSDAPEDAHKPKMQRFRHGVAPSDDKRRAELAGRLPPVHPLYKLLVHASPQICLTIVDELHEVCNPTTYAGHVVGMFTAVSTYKLGLTGTPVTSKPGQLGHLAKTLDAMGGPVPRRFVRTKDGEHTLDKAAVRAFHRELVDRVDASFLDLPAKRQLLIEYDPFVGLRTDGTADAEAIEQHNSVLASAQQLVQGVAAPAVTPAFPSQWGEEQRAAFSAIIALGNFEFSSVLGTRGAEAFKAEPELYDAAAEAPSQAMRLIWRVVRSRQQAGHRRVAVFSESTTQLKILRRYLQGTRAVGEVFLFDGTRSAKQRGAMVKEFLACHEGVLLLSSAGKGITLCPGCEVLLSVGSLPWNAATVDQAFGRVHRIGQNRPVEIIQFAARRSVTFAKLRLHDDKRLRLAKAAADEDFSHFVNGESRWRQTQRILSACVPLDARGNYQVSREQVAKLRAYQRVVEACDANGMARPAPPPDLPQPPLLADRVVLPDVSFAQSEFVDVVADCVADSDDE